MFEKYKKDLEKLNFGKVAVELSKDILYGAGNIAGKACCIVIEGFNDGIKEKNKEKNNKDKKTKE